MPLPTLHDQPVPRRGWQLNLLLLAGTLFVFLPTWLWLVEAWLSDPYYSHGPLVLAAILYLLWNQRKHLTAGSPLPNNGGWLLLVVAFAVHVWAIVWRAYYISALMIPLALLGLLLTLYGWRITRQFLFPLGLTVLILPLPLAERFGPVLEAWTASTATVVAQMLGVAARNVGSEVFLPNSAFTVGIPCGGLRSAIAILSLGTLWAYIVRGGVWARGLVVLAAIPLALAANTLRIALIFIIANAWGAQAGVDFHAWSSPLLFGFASVLLVVFARAIGLGTIRWEILSPQ